MRDFRRFLIVTLLAGCASAGTDGFLDGFDTPRPSPTALAPLALPDSYEATADTTLLVGVATGVLANDVYDGDGTLAAFVATLPTNGSVSLQPSGSFSYTPTLGFSGEDSFAYVASDGDVGSEPTRVAIQVSPDR